MKRAEYVKAYPVAAYIKAAHTVADPAAKPATVKWAKTFLASHDSGSPSRFYGERILAMSDAELSAVMARMDAAHDRTYYTGNLEFRARIEKRREAYTLEWLFRNGQKI